jgi:RNA polymerase-interacting CarD/CdnL/TRCF family regulator
MGKTKRFKVGSKLIEKGVVYRVYKIEIEKTNGKVERVIHYRPYYTDYVNSTLVCSIPESSLDENIRRPVSKKEINELLRDLSKKSRKRNSLDAVKAKKILNSNDIHKTAKVLKKYWREKKRNGASFTGTKRGILEIAINRIIEEIAIVKGTSLDKAKKEITSALNG